MRILSMASPLVGIARSMVSRARKTYRRKYGYTISAQKYSISFHIKGKSDRYVFKEIFGEEDAYHKDSLIPLMTEGVVVDIGAHRGFFAVFAGTVAKRVLAFEPSPLNYSFLVKNVKLNRMSHVEAWRQAVSNVEGRKSFLISGETAARNTFFRSPLSGSGAELDVSCTTLQHLMRDHSLDHIDLLKIDCEGGEYDIIMDADVETLGKISAIALEIHEGPGIPGTKSAMTDFLEAAGFRGSAYDERVMEGVTLTMALFVRPEAVAWGRDGR